ncbi:hypothetical protein B5P42_31300, partial [Bacillus sp. SRB_331]
MALLTSLAKLVESIIEHRLRQQSEKHIPKNQSGCRPAHSTSHALLRLLHNSAIAAASKNRFAVLLNVRNVNTNDV